MPVFVRPGPVGSRDDEIFPWRYQKRDNGVAPGSAPFPGGLNGEPNYKGEPNFKARSFAGLHHGNDIFALKKPLVQFKISTASGGAEKHDESIEVITAISNLEPAKAIAKKIGVQARKLVVKQIAIRTINKLLGAKVLGLGTYFHTTELDGYFDTHMIDGYTYNEFDGHWYTTSPKPFYGQFSWIGRAPDYKEIELNRIRRLGDLGNKLEHRSPSKDDSTMDNLKNVWKQLKDPEVQQHFEDLSRQTWNYLESLIKVNN